MGSCTSSHKMNSLENMSFPERKIKTYTGLYLFLPLPPSAECRSLLVRAPLRLPRERHQRKRSTWEGRASGVQRDFLEYQRTKENQPHLHHFQSLNFVADKWHGCDNTHNISFPADSNAGIDPPMYTHGAPSSAPRTSRLKKGQCRVPDGAAPQKALSICRLIQLNILDLSNPIPADILHLKTGLTSRNPRRVAVVVRLDGPEHEPKGKGEHQDHDHAGGLQQEAEPPLPRSCLDQRGRPSTPRLEGLLRPHEEPTVLHSLPLYCFSSFNQMALPPHLGQLSNH